MRSYFGTAISENLGRTPEGFLIARNVVVSRTATRIPQLYKESELVQGGSDIKVPVWRPRESVFDPASMASLEGKILCSPHPPVFISPQNVNTYQKGVVMNVRPGPVIDGEETLMADLVVTDQQLIDDILAGRLREVSVGYDCMYISGPDGDGYIQKNIVANHLAVCAQGRAGPAARIYDHQISQEGNTMIDAAQDAATYANEMNAIGAKLRNQSKDCRSGLRRAAMDAVSTEDPTVSDQQRLEAYERSEAYASECRKLHRHGNRLTAPR